jgi:hypothetical protein
MGNVISSDHGDIVGRCVDSSFVSTHSDSVIKAGFEGVCTSGVSD